MSAYFWLAIIIYITNEIPNVVSHHVYIILILVTTFKIRDILVEAFIVLFWWRTSVILEYIKISIHDVKLKRHPATNFAIISDKSLNQLSIVFIPVISKEFQPLQQNCIQAAFSVFVSTFGNFAHCWIFLICGPINTPALTFPSNRFNNK